MNDILKEVRACRLCEDSLALGPSPVVQASTKSKIVIIGQAPGIKVHNSGIPWDDKSGDNLRSWMGISKDQFYDPQKVALIPMGFCYPGKGKSGDLPPRKECAPAWHDRLLSQMNNVELTLLIGTYAQQYYLKQSIKPSLTETVESFAEYLPQIFVLPHPSPRNNIWKAKNPWFELDVLPELQRRISKFI